MLFWYKVTNKDEKQIEICKKIIICIWWVFSANSRALSSLNCQISSNAVYKPSISIPQFYFYKYFAIYNVFYLFLEKRLTQFPNVLMFV